MSGWSITTVIILSHMGIGRTCVWEEQHLMPLTFVLVGALFCFIDFVHFRHLIILFRGRLCVYVCILVYFKFEVRKLK